MAETVHLFLKASGTDIAGESTQTSLGREDSIECLYFQDSVRTAREKGTGMATGRRSYEPIVFRKRIDKMQSMSTLRTITVVTAFAGGVALACQSGSSTNTEHCFNNEGNKTCAELYGDERPFCVGPGESCEAAPGLDGCVAELPPDECYSPCGNGSLGSDDPSCLPEETGDGDGDMGDEDGDPGGDGDGDDYEPSPFCGDGELAEEEECDDGNDIDDDECSNACTAPACGDGIVQAGLGETCDDGDTQGGDACSASCLLPGTVIWSRFSDLPNASGRSVAVGIDGSIGVLAYASGLGYLVLKLDADGEVEWIEDAPPQASNISVGPDLEFVVGGVVDGKGQVWRFDQDGSLAWTVQVPLAPTSKIRDVGVDQAGSVTSVGSANGLGAMLRHSPSGELELLDTVDGATELTEVAVVPTGSAWVLRDTPHQLEHYSFTNELLGTSDDLSPLGDAYVDLATDEYGNVFLVGDSNANLEIFGLAKFKSDGALSWASYHDDSGVIEAAFAVAALPTGGAVVAGITNSDGQNLESDALLARYGADGIAMGDWVFDGAQNNDADWLQGVAVTPEGDAVAVGFHRAGGGDSQLWIMKVAM